MSREPVRSSRAPGSSFGASQGWLNQVARSEPDSSPTLTEVIERPRRRNGRGVPEDLDLDRPAAARLEVRDGDDRAVAVAVGKAQEQVPEGRDPRLARRLGELRPDPLQGAYETSSTLGRGQWTGASRSCAGLISEAPANDLMRGYWAASNHHQLGWPPSRVSNSTPPGTWVSISASGIGASAPARTVTTSAPSPRIAIVSARVDPAPPQATISSPTKPTASPLRNLPCASSRAAGATPPEVIRPAPRRAGRGFPPPCPRRRARSAPAGPPAAKSQAPPRPASRTARRPARRP